jgi:hypothetical protein
MLAALAEAKTPPFRSEASCPAGRREITLMKRIGYWNRLRIISSLPDNAVGDIVMKRQRQT